MHVVNHIIIIIILVITIIIIISCYETCKLVLGSLQLISTTLRQVVPGRDWFKSLPLSGEVGVATEDLMDGAEFELLGAFELLEATCESLFSPFEF